MILTITLNHQEFRILCYGRWTVPVYPSVRGDVTLFSGDSALCASSLTRGDAMARVNPSLSLESLELGSSRCLVLVVLRTSGSGPAPSASTVRCLVRVDRFGASSATSDPVSGSLCFVLVDRTGLGFSGAPRAGSGCRSLVRVERTGLESSFKGNCVK